MSESFNYGVVTQNTVVKDLNKADQLQNQRTVLLGSLVKIESVLGNGYFGVKFFKDNEMLESSLFHCQREFIAPIDDKLWPFLATVVSPLERVKLAKNKRRCEKVLQITKETIVTFAEYEDIYLGTVKYIGKVKGLGKCFGIQLHQKKDRNKCNGSYAGIQYFNCLPGYGIFTSIDKITPQTMSYSDNSYEASELDKYVEKNVSSISNNNTNLQNYNTSSQNCNNGTLLTYNNLSGNNLNKGSEDCGNNSEFYNKSLDSYNKTLESGKSSDSYKTSTSYKNSDLYNNKEHFKNTEPHKTTEAIKNSDLFKNSDSIKNFDSVKNSDSFKNVESYKSSDSYKKSDVYKNSDSYKNSSDSCKNMESFKNSDSFKNLDSYKTSNSLKSSQNQNKIPQAGVATSDSYKTYNSKISLEPASQTSTKNSQDNFTTTFTLNKNSNANGAVQSLSTSPQNSNELDDSKIPMKENCTKTMKSSQSLQNITGTNSINTNNDFDQNTIIQPDNTHLIKQQQKLKNMPTKSTAQFYTSEIDLIDSIGGIWSGSTESEQLEKFSNFKSTLDKDKHESGEKSKSGKNKTSLTFSQLLNGKNLPKKKNNEEKICYDTNLEPGVTNDLTIGTLIEITNNNIGEPLYGVIRWMGQDPDTKLILIGVELEDEHDNVPLTLTDGTHNGTRYFECPNKKGVFVPISQCQKDSRFQDGAPTPVHTITEKLFGKMNCPVVEGFIAPLCLPTEEDVDAVCGKFRGIQGHHNSCYLDATLFSMFTYTGVFDSLLYRPKTNNDIPDYEEVQKVLREEVVNPLRTSLFVGADRVMTLRKLLDRLSSVSGLTSEEKDPEEFLNSLLAQILKAEPFLKLNSGQESYYYQLFVEKDERLELPTVQQLFEQSFFTSDIKLKEVPSCLIIQMPRFGKSYKMYPRILPSQLLDVTDIIENSPRQCTVCGKLAKWECRQCFSEGDAMTLENTTFCNKCVDLVHSHSKRSNHEPRHLNISHDFSIMAEHCPPPRLFMELFAVICIETSHYVAFVKCGVGHEAPWCFFDSMADRKGERNGYNIPEMVACPDVSKWLSDETICRSLNENAPHDRLLPEHARRLLCDAYICMYQSPDVLMYR